MSGLDEFGKIMGAIAQSASDFITLGPAGEALRITLVKLQQKEKKLVVQYSQINGDVTAWRDPLDECGKKTSAIAQQTSDYIHGIAVNYARIIQDNASDVPTIRQLADANVVKPLLDIPIPGTIGGIPSILIPGVLGVKIIEGIVNLEANSYSLPVQVSKAKDAIKQVRDAIQKEETIRGDLVTLKDYFLEIANELLDVYRRTTGLTSLPHFVANSPTDLKTVDTEMKDAIDKITNVKNNAFTVCRFIVNLMHDQKIKGKVTEAQISYIAGKLNAVDDIHTAFETEDNIRVFVQNFFGANLLTPAVLLHIPPAPDNIKPYLTETSSQHQTETSSQHQEFTDPNSSQFDPPPMDLSDFPT